MLVYGPIDDFTMMVLGLVTLSPFILLGIILIVEIYRTSRDLHKLDDRLRPNDDESKPAVTCTCCHCGNPIKPGDIAFSIDMARGNGLLVCKECDRRYNVVYDLCDQEGRVYSYHWEMK